jgi:hypothetical protein
MIKCSFRFGLLCVLLSIVRVATLKQPLGGMVVLFWVVSVFKFHFWSVAVRNVFEVRLSAYRLIFINLLCLKVWDLLDFKYCHIFLYG